MAESNYQREKRLLFEFLQNTPSTTSSGGSSPAGSGGGSSGGSSSGGSSVAIPASLGNVIPLTKYVATNPGNTRLKKALINQLNYFFSNPGPVSPKIIKEIGDGGLGSGYTPTSAISGYCAGYAYNIIKDLKEAWKTNVVSKKGWDSSGHAWQNDHLTNINNTGLYDMYYIGYNTKEYWKSWVRSQKWNYGDVLNYRIENNVDKLGYHTQVYTNDIYKDVLTTYWDTKYNKRQPENRTYPGWTTSNKKNYGTGFVYNKDYGNGTNYHMYAFKVKEEFLKG